MAKSRANVRAISALSDLRGALGQFAGEAQENLRAAEQEIQRTLAWLEQRRAYWRAEVRRCEAAVQAAARALSACLASPPTCYSDGHGGQHCTPPDCSAQAAALRRAQQKLTQAQAELRNVEQWLQHVQNAVEAYRPHARRLQHVAAAEIPKAQALLNRKVGELEAYTNLLAPSSHGVSQVSLIAATAPVLLGCYFMAMTKYLNSARNAAVRNARRQEIALVQRTGRGTRDWKPRQLEQLKKGHFPKGFQGHHGNSVKRFPHLADNPDNIHFVTFKEHLRLHWGRFQNATSHKMFNRKSMMVQWSK